MQRWGIVLFYLIPTLLLADPSEVDTSFVPRLPRDHFVTTVFEQENGNLLVGGWAGSDYGFLGFLLRLKSDGRIDHTFRVRGKRGFIADVPTQICVRPDSQIGVLGLSGLYELWRDQSGELNVGEAVLPFGGAAVLRRGGRVNQMYWPEEGPWSGRFLADGSIVYPAKTNSWIGLNGDWAQLRRLDPNGRVVWSGEAITPRRPDKGKSTSVAWCRALLDGTVVAGIVNIVQTWYRPWQPVQDYRHTRYYLYSSAWGQMQINIDSGGFANPAKAYAVVAPGPTNSLYVGGGPHLGILTRRLPGWQVDPSFTFQSSDPNATIRAIAVQQNGKILYSFVNSGTNQLFRCNPDGSRDPSFMFGEQGGECVQDMLVLRNGKMLAWGSFTDETGDRHQTFVRLNTD